MRNISFALTEPQLLDGSKTVTRRLGWRMAKAGDRLSAVRKAMGLKPGEKIHRLAVIEVVSTRREPLDSITAEDVAREGFPSMTPAEFVAFFCKHMGGGPEQVVTRIEFKRVEPERAEVDKASVACPACPTCKVNAGTRVDAPRGRLRCAACGRCWQPSADELAQAIAADQAWAQKQAGEERARA